MYESRHEAEARAQAAKRAASRTGLTVEQVLEIDEHVVGRRRFWDRIRDGFQECNDPAMRAQMVEMTRSIRTADMEYISNLPPGVEKAIERGALRIHPSELTHLYTGHLYTQYLSRNNKCFERAELPCIGMDYLDVWYDHALPAAAHALGQRGLALVQEARDVIESFIEQVAALDPQDEGFKSSLQAIKMAHRYDDDSIFSVDGKVEKLMMKLLREIGFRKFWLSNKVTGAKDLIYSKKNWTNWLYNDWFRPDENAMLPDWEHARPHLLALCILHNLLGLGRGENPTRPGFLRHAFALEGSFWHLEDMPYCANDPFNHVKAFHLLNLNEWDDGVNIYIDR